MASGSSLSPFRFLFFKGNFFAGGATVDRVATMSGIGPLLRVGSRITTAGGEDESRGMRDCPDLRIQNRRIRSTVLLGRRS